MAATRDAPPHEVDVVVKRTRHGPVTERRLLGGEDSGVFDASDLALHERTLGARMSVHGGVKHLKLARCGLSRCPTAAFTAETLQSLDLGGNALKDLDRLEGSAFPALRRFCVAGNRLASLPGPQFWAGMPRLRCLLLGSNALDDAALSAACPLPPGLHEVTLSANRGITRIPRACVLLRDLRLLRADGCALAELPPDPPPWRSLHTLAVARNALTTVPGWALALPSLERLDLGWNRLTSAPVPTVPRPGRPPGLVDLRGNDLLDAAALVQWLFPGTVVLDDEWESAEAAAAAAAEGVAAMVGGAS